MRRSRILAFACLVLGLAALGGSVFVARRGSHPRSASTRFELSTEEAIARLSMRLPSKGFDNQVPVTWSASAAQESGLRSAAETLRGDFEFIDVRFHPQSDELGGDDRWWLDAKRFTVPSVENLCTIRDRVKKVVESLGARYEGFGLTGMR